MKKTYISWEEYYKLIDKLALKIARKVKDGEINQILALARGGNIIGDALSRKLNLPLAIMFTSSYTGYEKSDLLICEEIAKQYNSFGNKILIVDDLLDSGATMDYVKVYIENKYHSEVYTAVLWKKTTCKSKVNYYVEDMQPTEWIVQPFENVK